MNDLEFARSWAAENSEAIRVAMPSMDAEDRLLLSVLLPSIARDDVGWTPMAGGNAGSAVSGYDLPVHDRVTLLRNARGLHPIQAHARKIVELWEVFLVGKGLRFRIAGTADGKSVPKALKTEMASIVANFRYRDAFSMRGQRRTLARMILDGETFHVLSPTHLRHLDPLSVTGIATPPDDPDAKGWVLADRIGPDRNPVRWAWRTIDSTLDESAEAVPLPNEFVARPGFAHHFVWGGCGARGISYLAPALPWISRVRAYLLSRAGVMAAVHRIAMHVSAVNGDSAAASRALSILRSNMDASTGAETNPPPAGASVLNTTGLDVKERKFDTGAAGAAVDLNVMLSVLGAGAGTPASYLGGEGAANLAGAASAELPTMATYESYQALLGEFYSELLKTAMIAREPSRAERIWNLDVEVAAPRIERRAQNGFLASIASILGQTPELKENEEFLRVLCSVLQLDDSDEAAEELAKAVREAKAEAKAMADKVAEDGAGPRSDRGAPRPERSPVDAPSRATPDGGPDADD